MLPAGVTLVALTPHADERGVFTELYRSSWEPGVEPVQWNAVRSEANVLRGVHVHRRHTDYLTVVSGLATIGLHDLRPGSPTEGVATTLRLEPSEPAALVLPVGVAHGFYFHEPSIHVYAVSHEFDPADRASSPRPSPRGRASSRSHLGGITSWVRWRSFARRGATRR